MAALNTFCKRSTVKRFMKYFGRVVHHKTFAKHLRKKNFCFNMHNEQPNDWQSICRTDGAVGRRVFSDCQRSVCLSPEISSEQLRPTEIVFVTADQSQQITACRSPKITAALRRDFQPTQRTQREERDEMTSLLDRPITAASDDGVCPRHAAKMWQTRAKLLKLNLICIMSCKTSNKSTKIWTTDLF